MSLISLQNAFDFLSKNAGRAFVYRDGVISDWNLISSPINHMVHIYPGSFNPLHDGHKTIWELIKSLNRENQGCFGANSWFFEISVKRVGKRDLSFSDLSLRLKQFNDIGPVVLTNVPRFIQKAGVLKRGKLNYGKLMFHIGSDTAHRLIDDLTIDGIGGINAEFTVYDRYWGGPTNLSSEIYDAAPNFSRGPHIPEDMMSLSSTAIRNTFIGEN